jgi:hypothetical protein
MNTAIIPTNNIQGDITSCKIETALTKIDKEWALSLTQISHYQSYDVCTKEVVETYHIQEITPAAFGLGFMIAIFIVLLIGFIAGLFNSDF